MQAAFKNHFEEINHLNSNRTSLKKAFKDIEAFDIENMINKICLEYGSTNLIDQRLRELKEIICLNEFHEIYNKLKEFNTNLEHKIDESHARNVDRYENIDIDYEPIGYQYLIKNHSSTLW